MESKLKTDDPHGDLPVLWVAVAFYGKSVYYDVFFDEKDAQAWLKAEHAEALATAVQQILW